MSHRKIFVIPSVMLAVALIFPGCVQQHQPAGPSVRPANEPQPAYLEHTISFSGETLADIAAWYTGKATNWQIIRDANPSVKPNNLKLGQTILIPRSLVINDKPFSRTSLKRMPVSNKPAEVSPTPGPSDNDLVPVPGRNPETGAPDTGAPDVGNPTEPVVAPVPTEAPEVVPTPVAASTPAAAGPSSDDLEREKLLDELLK